MKNKKHKWKAHNRHIQVKKSAESKFNGFRELVFKRANGLAVNFYNSLASERFNL